MIKRRTTMGLTAIAFAALVAGCGGGGPVIDGFAATGAAMAGATVTARCVNGPDLTAVADDNGLFRLRLPGRDVLPCMVRAVSSDRNTILHSYTAETGRLNVTPLTELTVSKALGADPATAFDSAGGFDSAEADTIGNGLTAAKASIRAQVETLTGRTIAGDLFTSVFKVRDPDDLVLDELNRKLAAAGKQLSELRANAAANAPLVPAMTAANRGTLVTSALVVGDLDQPMMDLMVHMAGARALAGTPQCGVKVVGLHYNTVGVIGEEATASAAMLVPTGCTPNGALVAYAKGTDVVKRRTLADYNDDETRLLMMMYAAQGYTVVATDYLGFAKSSYSYHPFLHADSQANAIIDAIRAARRAAPALGATLSGNVMLTGYSQGGHASMAAQRAIEADAALANEISVVAAAHLAGPYNLAKAVELNAPILGYQIFVPYMVASWQRIYGDLYTKVSDVFKAPYASYIETLLPSSQYSYESLYSSGRLPYVAPDQAQAMMFDAAYLQAAQASASHPLRVAGLKNQLLGWGPKADVMLCSGSQDPTVPFQLHQHAAYLDLNSRATAQRTLATQNPAQARSSPVGTVLFYEVTGATSGSVWGNGIYTDDSSIAAAAVHAGVLASGQTGVVKVTLLGAQNSFSGTFSNGVTSSNYGAWVGSYSVGAAGPAPEKVLSVDVDDTVMQLHGASFDITKYHGTYVPPLCHAQARQFFNQKFPS